METNSTAHDETLTIFVSTDDKLLAIADYNESNKEAKGIFELNKLQFRTHTIRSRKNK